MSTKSNPSGGSSSNRSRNTTSSGETSVDIYEGVKEARKSLPPLKKDLEFEVLWEHGSLGLIFAENKKFSAPVVSKLTDSVSSKKVSVGDMLIYVNKVHSERHSFSQFFTILGSMKKPVLLRFRRKTPLSSTNSAPSVSPTAVTANKYSGGSSSNKSNTERKGSQKVLHTRTTQESKSLSTHGGESVNSKVVNTKISPRLSETLNKKEDDDYINSNTSDTANIQETAQAPTKKGWKTLTLPKSIPSIARSITAAGMRGVSAGNKTAESEAPQLHAARLRSQTTVASPNLPNSAVDEKNRHSYVGPEIRPSSSSTASTTRKSGTKLQSHPSSSTPENFEKNVQRTNVSSERSESHSNDWKSALPSKLPLQDKTDSACRDNPVSLSFISSSSDSFTSPDSDEFYEFVWESGSLGLYFGEEQRGKLPIVTRTNQSKKDLLKQVHRGDTLIAANDIRAENYEFASFFKLLQEMEKPVVLRFRSTRYQYSSSINSNDSNSSTGSNDNIAITTISDGENAPNEPTKKCQEKENEVDIDEEKDKLSSEKNTVNVNEFSDSDSDSSVDDSVDIEEETLAILSPSEAICTDIKENSLSANGSNKIDHEKKESVMEVFAEEVDEELSVGQSVSEESVDKVIKEVQKNDKSIVENREGEVKKVGKVEEVDQDDVGREEEDEEEEEEEEDDIEVESIEENELLSIEDEMKLVPPPHSSDLLDPDLGGSTTSPKSEDDEMRSSSVQKKKTNKSSTKISDVMLGSINEESSETKLALPDQPLHLSRHHRSTSSRGKIRHATYLYLKDKRSTPDSRIFMIKWKEGHSVGLEVCEVKLRSGIFPMVRKKCQEPCCHEVLKHVSIGDLILEVNGKNTLACGVKKTNVFFQSCTKNTVLKFKRGPLSMKQRVNGDF